MTSFQPSKLAARFDINENTHSKKTICEAHRAMYKILVARNPDDPVIPLLHRAFLMAKIMGNKLRKYRFDYDDGWWKVHRLDGGDLDANDQTQDSPVKENANGI